MHLAETEQKNIREQCNMLHVYMYMRWPHQYTVALENTRLQSYIVSLMSFPLEDLFESTIKFYRVKSLRLLCFLNLT